MSNLQKAIKYEGILLINKPTSVTSFSLIPKLRYIFNEKKIGHGGTLDPLATGVMIYLIGRNYTKTADTYLQHDKEYIATILLGEERDSYDIDGNIIKTSDLIPDIDSIHKAIENFNGQIEQIPPMYSAKKIKGKKLYELARAGKEVKRNPKLVSVKTTLIDYNYPYLKISVVCSSGTYIRSIAHDLGEMLNCFGCIQELQRTRSGNYNLSECFSIDDLQKCSSIDKLLKTH